ncbi:hypothetical protein GF324_14630, partial [bacterium]|nr:hypothetical protein [bacterium]
MNRAADAVRTKPTQADTHGGGRIPPSDLVAEQSVLGAILQDPHGIDKAQEHIIPEAFYWEKHRTIYQAMLTIRRRGEAVDLTTLATELTTQEKLEHVGGLYYLTEIT